MICYPHSFMSQGNWQSRAIIIIVCVCEIIVRDTDSNNTVTTTATTTAESSTDLLVSIHFTYTHSHLSWSSRSWDWEKKPNRSRSLLNYIHQTYLGTESKSKSMQQQCSGEGCRAMDRQQCQRIPPFGYKEGNSGWCPFWWWSTWVSMCYEGFESRLRCLDTSQMEAPQLRTLAVQWSSSGQLISV